MLLSPSKLVLTAVVALTAAPSLSFRALASSSDDDRFEALHERGSERESSLVTLRADFVETVESALLVDPLVSRGRMIAARPLRLRLDYETPEPKTILIQEDMLRVLWPERGEREALPIGDIQKTVDKYFTKASAKQLRGHFEIEVQDDPELPGTHRIVMRPKRKQIKVGLELLELWLLEPTLDMVQIRMVYPGGDSRTVSLSNLRVNETIEDSEFTAGVLP